MLWQLSRWDSSMGWRELVNTKRLGCPEGGQLRSEQRIPKALGEPCSSTRGMGKEVSAREKQGQRDSGAHVGCEQVARGGKREREEPSSVHM